MILSIYFFTGPYVFKPAMFFTIFLAIAFDNTLASVLGYVINFFSYKVCKISNVLLGLILNIFEHSACISAKLKSRGGFL